MSRQFDLARILSLPASGRKVEGTWRRESDRFLFSHAPIGSEEPASADKWFRVMSATADELRVAIEGTRLYTWKKAQAQDVAVASPAAGFAFAGTSPTKGCRITATLAETGEGRIAVERLKPGSPSGNPSGTLVRSEGNGVFTTGYDFARLTNLEETGISVKQHLSLDRTAGRLVFTPGDVAGQPGKVASLSLPGSFKLPFTFSVDVPELGPDTNLLVQWNFFSSFVYVLDLSSADGLTSRLNLTARWANRKPGVQPDPVSLIRSTVNLDQPWETNLRVPLPEGAVRDRIGLEFAARGRSIAAFTGLTLKAPLIPPFGVAWGDGPKGAFVSRVITVGIAGKAGVAEGDVVLSINGRKPASAVEAMRLLADVKGRGGQARDAPRQAGIDGRDQDRGPLPHLHEPGRRRPETDPGSVALVRPCSKAWILCVRFSRP